MKGTEARHSPNEAPIRLRQIDEELWNADPCTALLRQGQRYTVHSPEYTTPFTLAQHSLSRRSPVVSTRHVRVAEYTG